MKNGILHDYDLEANFVDSAKGHKCLCCDAFPTRFQWSDYNGEGMCAQCGFPYQLKNGSEEMQREGKYPYVNLRDAWIPIVREYFSETGKFTHLGSGASCLGLNEFYEWVGERHPEMLATD